MATASFLAGALPLSMSLSQSQLRLISSIGVGILVGTSLIVIIPEGVEAIASSSRGIHTHNARSLAPQPWFASRGVAGMLVPVVDESLGKRQPDEPPISDIPGGNESISEGAVADEPFSVPPSNVPTKEIDADSSAQQLGDSNNDQEPDKTEDDGHHEHDHVDEMHIPTFEIGVSLITGFVLMFLIDRLPRHATERFQPPPATRHISLDNLSVNENDEETVDSSFIGSFTPSPRQSRSLATTLGLVIHAAADGIAMGASATAENMKLSFIIFIAIMIHKAPAAFGLTSLLLKQGLSKRAARGHLIIFSLAAPVGAITTWLLITLLGGGKLEGESGSWWSGILLLFSAGTFLYVAMHAMNEEDVQDHAGPNGNGYSEVNGIGSSARRSGTPQIRDTLFTIAGMLLPLLTQFGHHH